MSQAAALDRLQTVFRATAVPGLEALDVELRAIAVGHGADEFAPELAGGDEAVAEAILTEFVDDLAG